MLHLLLSIFIINIKTYNIDMLIDIYVCHSQILIDFWNRDLIRYRSDLQFTQHCLCFDLCRYRSEGGDVSSGLVVDRFAPSVSMSTYLVAFIVCDYKNLTAYTSNGIRVGYSSRQLTFIEAACSGLIMATGCKDTGFV